MLIYLSYVLSLHRTPQPGSLLRRHHEDRRGPVIDPGGIAGCHRPGSVFDKGRPQLGKALCCGVRSGEFIHRDEKIRLSWHWHGNRSNFRGEVTRSDCLPGPLLAASGKLVLLLPCEVPLLGHILSGDPHVDGEEGVGEAVSEQAVLETNISKLHSWTKVDCVPGPMQEIRIRDRRKE